MCRPILDFDLIQRLTCRFVSQEVQTGDIGNRIVQVHHLHLHTLASEPSLRVFDASETFVKPTDLHSPKVQIPRAVVDLLEADVLPAEHVLTLTQPLCHRMPPFALTKRTSKWAGYSIGGGVLG